MTPLRKLVVVGVGLIGGSFALALRRARLVHEVVGIGRTRANLDVAIARGAIDRAVPQDAPWAREARDADVVLLALPVAQCAAAMAALAPHLGIDTLLTDAGSTKADVVAAARTALGAALPRFVPGHPIAGSERSGAAAADAALYQGREVILTPLPQTDPAALARVSALWQAAGARVSTLAPEAHDHALAAVSHLPHVLAFAFVEALARRPDADAVLAHAGAGFRDFTRIAASAPEMWRDIALANRAALASELDAYRGALDRVAAALAAGDGDALHRLFARAAQARRDWAARQSVPDGAADDA